MTRPRRRATPNVKSGIVAYHRDDEGHWVAELACGHFQHVRDQPPWCERPWLRTAAGRQDMLGFRLDCVKCDAGAPPDRGITAP
ncbi:MAG: DUF3565 domain-containing protein [Salinisphaera sp.]|nr:DUF3565 domain-containing protein [Salinisphaera sp.]